MFDLVKNGMNTIQIDLVIDKKPITTYLLKPITTKVDQKLRYLLPNMMTSM